jgi:hypothetical protein
MASRGNSALDCIVGGFIVDREKDRHHIVKETKMRTEAVCGVCHCGAESDPGDKPVGMGGNV